jgi:hypothetical protein
MTCHACWLSDLDKTPCIDTHGCKYDVSIPATVTLRCYAVMTKTWAKPDGRILLVSLIDGIQVTKNSLTKSRPMRESILHNMLCLSEDLGELRELANLAMEILPDTIPWSPGCPRKRVIELERVLEIKHAPFVADDGRGLDAYRNDITRVRKHGPAFRVSTWDEWFKLREDKKQEQADHGKRKKSGRRS